MSGISWIEFVEPDKAEGRTREVYERIIRERGRVANVFKAHSLNPDAMHAHLTLYMSIMFGRSPLSRADRELIASVVSATNRCEYCKTHHSEVLQKYLRDSSLVSQILEKFEDAPVDEARKEVIRFVRKLTLQPYAVHEDDVKRLRERGYDDRAILDIVLVTAYFNFVNRLVLGLGVKLEESGERIYKT